MKQARDRGGTLSVQHPLDLQAALKTLETWQAELPPDQQRRFPRFQARGEARLLPGKASALSGDCDTVYIRDISRGGVSVVAGQPIAIGTFWQVQIGTEHICLGTIAGVCRYARPVLPGAYLCGIEFGIDASILMALGVTATQLGACDGGQCDVLGDCVAPGNIDGLEAA